MQDPGRRLDPWDQERLTGRQPGFCFGRVEEATVLRNVSRRGDLADADCEYIRLGNRRDVVPGEPCVERIYPDYDPLTGFCQRRDHFGNKVPRSRLFGHWDRVL